MPALFALQGVSFSKKKVSMFSVVLTRVLHFSPLLGISVHVKDLPVNSWSSVIAQT